MLQFQSSHNSPEAQPKPGLLLSHTLFQRAFDQALDLLFPPQCAGCGKVDTHWCESCQQEVDLLPLPPLPLSKLESDSFITALAATGPHEGKLQKAIWSLKFENDRALAFPLGQRLAMCLASLNWTIDILVPVPLHTKRLRERGYNQSELLARHAAARGGLPVVTEAIYREVETRSQVGLDAQQRKENMKGVFRARAHVVSNKAILLIDDVCTTGATLEACAQAALEAGAAAVYGLTVSTA